MGGFSKIFDTVGNSETLNTSMRVLRTAGILSVIGISEKVKLDITPLWLKLQTIKGVYSYGFTDVNSDRKHVFELAIDFVNRKKVHLESLVTHTFSLEDYHEMIKVNLNKPKYKAVKTVVCFTKGS
jgi:(R,R)-butanediol dehydrogenase/meso-butanediol dehydrogenase/diacetyl reductase